MSTTEDRGVRSLIAESVLSAYELGRRFPGQEARRSYLEDATNVLLGNLRMYDWQIVARADAPNVTRPRFVWLQKSPSDTTIAVNPEHVAVVEPLPTDSEHQEECMLISPFGVGLGEVFGSKAEVVARLTMEAS